jgi:hypothetical protein
MAAGRSITYTVSTFANGTWKQEGQTRDLDKALGAAEHLFGTRRFQRVKVEQTYIDEASHRNVVTTVFNRQLPRVESAIWLLLLSVILAIATFFLVRWGLATYWHS